MGSRIENAHERGAARAVAVAVVPGVQGPLCVLVQPGAVGNLGTHGTRSRGP